MNRVYRVIWCHARQLAVVVSELAHTRGTVRDCSASQRHRMPRVGAIALAIGMVLISPIGFAQSAPDAKLADLQSVMDKYAATPASRVEPAAASPTTAPVVANASVSPMPTDTVVVDRHPVPTPPMTGDALSRLPAVGIDAIAIDAPVLPTLVVTNAIDPIARALGPAADTLAASDESIDVSDDGSDSDPAAGGVIAVLGHADRVADRRRAVPGAMQGTSLVVDPAVDDATPGGSLTDHTSVVAAGVAATPVSSASLVSSAQQVSGAMFSADSLVSAMPVQQAVPVVPPPSGGPTGLIVGNGGVVGATSQILGTSTNALFQDSSGYVTNGTLRVNNANFVQGYSTVNALGVPLLNLTAVGTVLTTTGGTVLGGTGINSHLTLIGGVNSDNYITHINNGATGGLLGVVLPSTAPAWASRCLNVLGVVTEDCWAVNAAQDYQVLVGDGASANGSKEVVIGTNASHTLPPIDASVVFPGNGTNDPNNPTGVPTADYDSRLGHSVVIGDDAAGTANSQTIIGAEASSSMANSIALGYQSSATRGAQASYTAYGLATTQTSAGELSVGSSGQNRQITHVAAGSAATDAVNVAQLQGATAAMDSAVLYDDASSTTVTLAGPTSTDGGATNGTRITNVQQGTLSATSTDAVNGAQLFDTNSQLTNIYTTGTKYLQVNSTGTASLATGTDSLAAGPAAEASGNSALAIGNGASASVANGLAFGGGAIANMANSVALGAGSQTTVGALFGYSAYGLAVPQTSTGEVNIGNRQITGVAAGSAATDAVNVAQLQGATAAMGTAVQYDDASFGTVTLAGPTSTDGGATNGTRITNVQQGTLSATSTDAVNGAQLFDTNSQLTNIYTTGTKYLQVNSTGTASVATGVDSLAAGPDAIASGDNALAIGNGASASAIDGLALGGDATASMANSVALGAGSQTVVGALTGYSAYGLAALQNSSGEVNVGNRQITGVAAGSASTDAVNVAQLQGLAASMGNSVTYDDASFATVTLAGPTSTDGGVSNGTRITNLQQGTLSETSTDAVNGAQLFDTNSQLTNIYTTGIKYLRVNSSGAESMATGIDSLAAGPGAVAAGDDTVAIGDGAQAANEGDVALGAGSISEAVHTGATAWFGGVAAGTPSSSFSVGATGAERQIQGVAAGVLSAASTDAVNGSQLFSLASGVDVMGASLAAALGGASSYDGATGQATAQLEYEGITYGSVQDVLNALTSSGPSAYLKYVHINSAAGDSTATGDDSISIGPMAAASGDDSVALGHEATAGGSSSMALGDGASAAADNSIALGANSVATTGALTNYTAFALDAPQTSAGELNIGNRQLTGVAAGSADTDAVNVAQLNAVEQMALGNGLSVQYDADEDGSAMDSVTLSGSGSGQLVALTRLAAGAVNSSSVDAINGGQMWEWTQDPGNVLSNYSLYKQINNLSSGDGTEGGGTLRYFNVNSTLADSSAVGQDSVAIGPEASAEGGDSVALGNGAIASGENSVAIGAQSVADRDDTVSVGSAGAERQISHVAAGTEATDAVNMEQLQASESGTVRYDTKTDGSSDYSSITLGSGSGTASIHNVSAGVASSDAVNVEQLQSGMNQTLNWANAYTDQKLRDVNNRANAGIASAMAMAGLPQAYEPGKSMASIAGSTFHGESSVALGISMISEGGRWVYKLTGSTSTRGDSGVAIGAGIQW